VGPGHGREPGRVPVHAPSAFTIAAGERVIYGQRVLGEVRLVDVPAAGQGRRYLIERELTVMAEFEVIVEDYLDQAARWQVIPAAGACYLADRSEELLA
jgi:hypothetical protein